MITLIINNQLTDEEWQWAYDVINDFTQICLSTLNRQWHKELNDGEVMDLIKIRSLKAEPIVRKLLERYPVGCNMQPMLRNIN